MHFMLHALVVGLPFISTLDQVGPGPRGGGHHGEEAGRQAPLCSPCAARVPGVRSHAYFSWCDEAARNTKFSIGTAEKKKAELEAAIGKATGDIEASDATIEELAKSISTGQGDLDSATTIRAKEAQEFGVQEAELVDVVDTLGRAISILEKDMAKNPAALAQISTAPGIDGLTTPSWALRRRPHTRRTALASSTSWRTWRRRPRSS